MKMAFLVLVILFQVQAQAWPKFKSISNRGWNQTMDVSSVGKVIRIPAKDIFCGENFSTQGFSDPNNNGIQFSVSISSGDVSCEQLVSQINADGGYLRFEVLEVGEPMQTVLTYANCAIRRYVYIDYCDATVLTYQLIKVRSKINSETYSWGVINRLGVTKKTITRGNGAI